MTERIPQGKCTERWGSHERPHKEHRVELVLGTGWKGSALHSWFLEAMHEVWSSSMPKLTRAHERLSQADDR